MKDVMEDAVAIANQDVATTVEDHAIVVVLVVDLVQEDVQAVMDVLDVLHVQAVMVAVQTVLEDAALDVQVHAQDNVLVVLVIVLLLVQDVQVLA